MADNQNKNIQDVIKNPARLIPLPQHKYEPEYIRLGIEPEIKNINIIPDGIPGNVEIKDDLDTWSSVDGVMFDKDGNDLDIMSGHIIDNNDFVDTTYFAKPQQTQSVASKILPTKEQPIKQPEVGDYILMVLGKLILTGTLEIIQTRVKSIIYGEDDAFKQMNVNIDDIVVLKRINIKIGVFLEDK